MAPVAVDADRPRAGAFPLPFVLVALPAVATFRGRPGFRFSTTPTTSTSSLLPCTTSSSSSSSLTSALPFPFGLPLLFGGSGLIDPPGSACSIRPLDGGSGLASSSPPRLGAGELEPLPPLPLKTNFSDNRFAILCPTNTGSSSSSTSIGLGLAFAVALTARAARVDARAGIRDGPAILSLPTAIPSNEIDRSGEGYGAVLRALRDGPATIGSGAVLGS